MLLASAEEISVVDFVLVATRHPHCLLFIFLLTQHQLDSAVRSFTFGDPHI